MPKIHLSKQDVFARKLTFFFSKNLIVLGFNDMSTLVGHIVLSTREREKRDSRAEREG